LNPRTRNLTHRVPVRALTRYCTRRLPGAPRRRSPNYLSLVCRAFKEIIRLDNHLRPYMQERAREEEQNTRRREVQAALQRVYGPSVSDRRTTPPQTPLLSAKEQMQLLRDEQALLKTQLLLANLRVALRLSPPPAAAKRQLKITPSGNPTSNR
jgi:hypothetical protein